MQYILAGSKVILNLKSVDSVETWGLAWFYPSQTAERVYRSWDKVSAYRERRAFALRLRFRAVMELNRFKWIQSVNQLVFSGKGSYAGASLICMLVRGSQDSSYLFKKESLGKCNFELAEVGDCWLGVFAVRWKDGWRLKQLVWLLWTLELGCLDAFWCVGDELRDPTRWNLVMCCYAMGKALLLVFSCFSCSEKVRRLIPDYPRRNQLQSSVTTTRPWPSSSQGAYRQE